MTARALPLALAALALTTACSGDGGDADRSGFVSRPGGDRTATAAASPSASARTGAASPTASTSAAAAAPLAAPATTAAAAPAPAQAPAAGAPAPAGAVAATPAGTYAYDVTGTVTVGAPQPVDAEAVLTVDPPSGGQQHTVLEGEQGRTEQDVVLRPDGRYLALLSITNPAFSKTVAPTPPVLLLPEPAQVGRAWSWSATSTDGATTVRAANRVLREETLTVGGERLRCTVVQTDLVLSGDVDYRGRTTTWVAQDRALPVREASRGSGTVSGVAFSSDTTSTLRSARPS